MKIEARVSNGRGHNEAVVSTNDRARTLAIPAKADGPGSDVNGGELLLLALATCYANDVHREARKSGVAIDRVDVTVEAEFGAEGEPGRNITYRARVTSPAAEGVIRDLLERTDRVAEIHNTLRAGTPVTLLLDRPS